MTALTRGWRHSSASICCTHVRHLRPGRCISRTTQADPLTPTRSVLLCWLGTCWGPYSRTLHSSSLRTRTYPSACLQIGQCTMLCCAQPRCRPMHCTAQLQHPVAHASRPHGQTPDLPAHGHVLGSHRLVARLVVNAEGVIFSVRTTGQGGQGRRRRWWSTLRGTAADTDRRRRRAAA